MFIYSSYLWASRDSHLRSTFESDSSSCDHKKLLHKTRHVVSASVSHLSFVFPCVVTAVSWDGQETVAMSERNHPSPRLRRNQKTRRWVIKKPTSSLTSIKMTRLSVITASLLSPLMSLQFLCTLASASGCCCSYSESLCVFWLCARESAT